MENKNKILIIFIATIVSLLIYVLPFLSSMPPQARSVLAITVFAMILWISEVIPLHFTAITVAGLLIVLGGFDTTKVLLQFVDKVIILVFGGFVIAVALTKYKLDEYFAQKVLGKFGNSSNKIILGMVFVTALISMWMSNSAAAAIAMPIALVILIKNKLKPGESNFGKAMVLAVAYGATIGGIGTIIGSTPNVITQKFLTENGIKFGFVEWGIRGFPFMLIMVIVCWLVLSHVFKPEIKNIIIKKHTIPFNKDQKKVIAIFLLTVLLWVTESWHGIHNSNVALVPVLLFLIFRLLNVKDFSKVSWDSLILIGGGIALGMAIDKSGLDDIFSSILGVNLAAQPYFVVLLTIALVGIFMTSFISNTAASSVLIPITTSLAALLGLNMTNFVVASAFGVSLDFIFPMGTPPSALAYSTKYVKIKDMIKAGLVISIIGAVILALFAYLTWSFK